jgi:hypothetical protein
VSFLVDGHGCVVLGCDPIVLKVGFRELLEALGVVEGLGEGAKHMVAIAAADAVYKGYISGGRRASCQLYVPSVLNGRHCGVDIEGMGSSLTKVAERSRERAM